jgi:hypothetical protein
VGLGYEDLYRAIAVAGHFLAGVGAGEFIVDLSDSRIAKPLFNGTSFKPEPPMGHLLVHPFLMMLYEVDNDHGTPTAADAAELCDGLLRIRQKVQHHDTKRSVYAARLQRQFQSVTAAELDIAELSFLSDHSCSPKHFL